MAEYLPVLLVGAVIGAFTLAFLIAYARLRKDKNAEDNRRTMPDKVIVKRLLNYAKPYWKQFLLVLVIFLCGLVTVLSILNIRLFRAAPEPVPPPSPVTSTKSRVPSKKARMASALSCAAIRPTSGSPPEPKPRFMPEPNCRNCTLPQARPTRSSSDMV